ncbi:MAG: sel1 repeat family protein [Desulfobacterales bacterium]|nr:sel1 repeat family protein [Desulfobacterales bacterium]
MKRTNYVKLVLVVAVLLMLVSCASKFDTLKKEADAGDPVKQYEVADHYLKTKDLVNAEKYAMKSADQGNFAANRILGRIYISRKEVKKGVALVLGAAEKGDPKSQHDMGSFYGIGKYLKRDLKEAVKWYKKAYKNGLLLAGFDLASVYRYEKKLNEAKDLYYKVINASEEQIEEKFKVLSFFYIAETEYAMNNKVDAFAWYCTSAASNVFQYSNNLGYVAQKMNKVRKELKPGELEKASRLSLELHHKYFVQFNSQIKRESSKILYKNTYFVDSDTLLRMYSFATIFGARRDKDNSKMGIAVSKLSEANYMLAQGSIKNFYFLSVKKLLEAFGTIKPLNDKNAKFLKFVIWSQAQCIRGMAVEQAKIVDEYKKNMKNKG